jgi:hypothetical protein
MSTSWRIEMGYGEGDWEDLKQAALDICNLWERILGEALAYDAPLTLDGENIGLYCIAFKERRDLTIEFIEPGHPMWNDEYPRPFIHMMASGGDPARTMKEHTRRAFLRLIMADMHKQGMDISVVVS